jgi:hypothetical protein
MKKGCLQAHLFEHDFAVHDSALLLRNFRQAIELQFHHGGGRIDSGGVSERDKNVPVTF